MSVGPNGVNILFENANRGKKSIGLDLGAEDGRKILYDLVRGADVLLTNKLPRVRKKLRIDVEDIRAQNPNIVYVRAGGLGENGPEADRGAYDLLTYWHRSGASIASASPEGQIPFLPAPGFGDFTGAMFIAGGVMGALYHRAKTGEATIVDASLLATGMWSMSSAIASSANDPNWAWPPNLKNPLSAFYRTRDGRNLALCCLQAGFYWRPLCEILERPDLAVDPRFKDHASILANHDAAAAILTEIFAGEDGAYWDAKLARFSGQWGFVQTMRDIPSDPQVAPNGYMQSCESAEGATFRLVTAPIQYGETPAPVARGPGFNEHGDVILSELGLDWDAIVDLKVRGVVA
jgi:crotonobetainyl-CoA:carnitine CoA-transferase CaiB-like acyl-CoA transferase